MDNKKWDVFWDTVCSEQQWRVLILHRTYHEDVYLYIMYIVSLTVCILCALTTQFVYCIIIIITFASVCEK